MSLVYKLRLIMKRRRIQISPVPDDVYQGLGENPTKLLKFMTDLGIEIPDESTFMILCLKLTKPKLDIRLFNDQSEYFLAYTNFLLKERKDYEFHSFRKSDDGWEMFLAPPIIGLGITTQLRPGLEIF